MSNWRIISQELIHSTWALLPWYWMEILLNFDILILIIWMFYSQIQEIPWYKSSEISKFNGNTRNRRYSFKVTTRNSLSIEDIFDTNIRKAVFEFRNLEFVFEWFLRPDVLINLPFIVFLMSSVLYSHRFLVSSILSTTKYCESLELFTR